MQDNFSNHKFIHSMCYLCITDHTNLGSKHKPRIRGEKGNALQNFQSLDSEFRAFC